MQEFSQRLDGYANMKKTNGELDLQLHRTEHELKGQQAVNAELLKQNGLVQEKLQVANQKLMELQQRNTELAELYEGKIGELKVLVERKAMELERLSAQVLPKFDQDMLRIKLLNQLELPHREELEAREEEIKRLETGVLELQKRLQLESSKNASIQQHRQQQLKLVQNTHKEEIGRLMHELSEVIARQNTNKDSFRRLKRENQELRNKLALNRKSFEERLEEVENVRHDNTGGYKFQTQISNLKKDVEHTRMLLRDSKEENSKLFRQLQKSREDYSKLALKWQEQETVLNQHKDRERVNAEKLEGLERHAAETDSLQSQLKSLRRELDISKEQTISEANKLKLLQKQLAQAYQSLRQSKRALEMGQTAKEPAYPPSTRLPSKSLDDLHLISDITKAKSQNLQLIERMTGIFHNNSAKERELQTALAELQTLKRHNQVSQQPPTRGHSPDDSTKLRDLKLKLKQANATIVQLLKEKVAAGRNSPVKNSFYN